VESARCLNTLQGHTGWVSAVALSADGRRALSGSPDGTLREWDLDAGRCLNNMTLESPYDGVQVVALSADGRRALSGSALGGLCWWDVEAKGSLHALFSAFIAICRSLPRRDAKASERLHILQEHASPMHAVPVDALALSSDGHRALSGSRDLKLRWWDLESGRCLHTLEGHTDEIYAVALSSDSRRALSGSADGALRWWDLEVGSCLKTLEGNVGEVYAVALSADGRRALWGSEDGALRWWDARTGHCLTVFTCDFPITAVAFSKQRPHRAVAGDAKGGVHFFDIVEPGEA
jgi:WD40 repeat protein